MLKFFEWKEMLTMAWAKITWENVPFSQSSLYSKHLAEEWQDVIDNFVYNLHKFA